MISEFFLLHKKRRPTSKVYRKLFNMITNDAPFLREGWVSVVAAIYCLNIPSWPALFCRTMLETSRASIGSIGVINPPGQSGSAGIWVSC